MVPPLVSTANLAAQLLWCILGVLLFLGAQRFVRHRRHWDRQLQGMGGGLYALPGVGNLYRLAGPMSTIWYRALRIYEAYKPTPLKCWIGEHPYVILARPDDVEVLMTAPRQVWKPDLLYKPVRATFGDGLIALSGPAWFHHRRLLTPVFHFNVLERYAGIFETRAAAFAAMLGRVEAAAGRSESFDVMKHHSHLVTETVIETALGVSVESATEEDRSAREEFLAATDFAFSIISQRVLQPWLLLDFIYKLTPWARAQARVDAIVERYAREAIQMKKLEIKKREEDADDGGVPSVDEDDDANIKRKYAFLDLVLSQNTDALTDAEVLDEVKTLITVQQTTATTLSFIMVMLALHPEAQRLAREEAVEARAQGLPALQRLNSLKYLECVIKETLRLFPVVPFFGRTLTEELHLSKFKLPAGLNVIVFPYATHRDPDHWTAPDTFDPDRFLAAGPGRHPFAFLPFSAGARNCIGQRYAILQMKAVLSAVLEQFTVLPGTGCQRMEDLKININVFLYIRGGFNVRLERLCHQHTAQ